MPDGPVPEAANGGADQSRAPARDFRTPVE
jgi:hypothetical protein